MSTRLVAGCLIPASGTYQGINYLKNATVPNLPVDVPIGVRKWRIRARWNQLAAIYLKYDDKIEWRRLGEKDGRLMPCGIIGVNRKSL